MGEEREQIRWRHNEADADIARDNGDPGLMDTGTADWTLNKTFNRACRQMVELLTRTLGNENDDLARSITRSVADSAISEWSRAGEPADLLGWLVRDARGRTLSSLRKSARLRGRFKTTEEWRRILTDGNTQYFARSLVQALVDDNVLTMLRCCHPELTVEQSCMYLITETGGFSAGEIARALGMKAGDVERLVQEAEDRVLSSRSRLDIPSQEELDDRIGLILSRLSSLFRAAWTARAGDSSLRLQICRESVRLAMLVSLNKETACPEALALVSSQLATLARFEAQFDVVGRIQFLPRQDRSRWDRHLAALARSYFRLADGGIILSSYHLEAAVALCHLEAGSWRETDWSYLLSSLELWQLLSPSPFVALQRVVAQAMVFGPESAMKDLDRVRSMSQLQERPELHVAMAEVAVEMGEKQSARAEYHRAEELAAQSQPVWHW